MKFTWLDLRFALALFVLATTVMAADADLQNGAFNKRQTLGGTGNSSPTPTQGSTTETETTTATNKVTTTPNSPTTETSITPTTLTSATPTLTSTTSSAAPSTSSPTPSTTSQSDTSKTTFTSTLMGSSTSQITFVALTTSSDGQVFSSTVTSFSVFSSPTGYATYTSAPGLVSSDLSGGTGLSIDSKKIIGGLVGGVGGLILIGGIALVCWRIWGRKRTPSDDGDYGSAGSLNREKGPSGQLTADTEDPLQRYQTPGKPNAAANF